MTNAQHGRARSGWTTAAVVVTTVVATLAASLWGGPFFSGALFLQWSATARPVAHDLPSTYKPVHQGHVDLSTGLYMRDDEDVVLSGTPPFVLRRNYTSGNHASTQFGVGAMSNAVAYLIGDPKRFELVELVRGDGSLVRFDRLTPGTSYLNAVFGEAGSPTAYWRAMVGWNGNEWVMRLRNGTVMWFLGCSEAVRGSLCVLDRIRDSDGHVTRFVRNVSGDLQTIDTGREQMTFAYDDQHRVVNITAGLASARYAYDAKGRLVRATTADAVREYSYDDDDHLVAVSEPGRSVENEFRDDGRLVRQVLHSSARTSTERFDYVVVSDSVIEERTTEDDGSTDTLRFNEAHYPTLESLEAPGHAPITVTFARASEQLVRSLTIRCSRNGEQVSTLVEEAPAGWERAKDDAIAGSCDGP